MQKKIRANNFSVYFLGYPAGNEASFLALCEMLCRSHMSPEGYDR